ncbi:MAG TPA: M23 family metallopeptidase [Jatrophihabitans sp.]|jgi:murein DD-endopeptidase MepM/ murein hydrolase activator NlpD|uniref:M23 family metallopeptidase n=1 Tax=Jatrophihabitans sp. TaxID=1932789 RepID=UPI002EF179AD
MSAMIAAMTLTMTLPASGGALAASDAQPGRVGVARATGAPGLAAAGGVGDRPYRAPLAGGLRVRAPFAPPAERYGRGHLGVDLDTPAGIPVLAAGAGTVRFAGPVAGRGVVVLAHPDGVSTEYEPVTATVRAGQRVLAGQRIGLVRGVHRGCAPEPCLHWGARRGGAYLDPMSLLGPLGVVRLLPWS